MDSRQAVELTIRTAQLMQAVAGMVGTDDLVMAQLHMEEIAKVTMELDRFVKLCE